MRLINKMLFK